ncbi:3-oxoacyl-ACP reductase FabG [Candidatus Aerophobetes bacterium]|nr:3-oxoacyl-ACP reductase FabG [Candidatus Aerophobetes bacterium]
MDLGLKNKVAIVTGGSQGIGRAICLALAEEKVAIVLNDVNISKNTEKVANEIRRKGGEIKIIRADVSNLREVEFLVKEAINTFGKIDILINNAGIRQRKHLLEISEGEWRKTIDIDLTGVFFCTQKVVKYMMEQKEGRIINISSIAARRGSYCGGSDYAAAKAGILGFTKTLARELAPYKITVNAILPGVVTTHMLEVTPPNIKDKLLKEIPLRRFCSPEEIASVVVFLCSKRASYITGISLDINGGQYM